MTISGHSALPSTERVEYRPESPLSRAQVEQVASRWDEDLDGPVDPSRLQPIEFTWLWPKWIRPVRRLYYDEAARVQRYINAILRNDYPYQIRELVGRTLWLEFCEYYAINPDIERAMKYI